MKVKIDKEKCVGCGRCTEICPNAFNLNTDGKAECLNQNADCIMKASDQCPVGAIFVEE